MEVRILEVSPGMPLEVNKIYKVNFETETHYIIFNNGIWCGIFKNDAEVVKEDYNALNNGQIMFDI